MAPPSSLLQTPAPIPPPLPAFGLRLAWGVWAGWLPAPAAAGIFPTLSRRIFPRVPGKTLRGKIVIAGEAGSRPRPLMGKADDNGEETGWRTRWERRGRGPGCRPSFRFRPPSLLISQIVPTAAPIGAGQLRFLHPGLTCFVASAHAGYANRPHTGNWRHGDFHSARFTALSAAPPCARYDFTELPNMLGTQRAGGAPSSALLR